MKAQVHNASKVEAVADHEAKKRPYIVPVLTKYGAITSLTRGTAGGALDDTSDSV